MGKVRCKLCGGEFDNKMFKLHIKNSHEETFESINEIDMFVLKCRYDLSDDLINEIISNYDGRSILSLSEQYSIPHMSIRNLFKLMDVKLKTLSETVKQNSVREKYKETCLIKHGVSNISKSNEIKKKKKETFIENYGVDNIFKTDEFKDKIDSIMLEKYGVKRISGWFSMSNEQRERQIKRIHSVRISNIESRIGKILVDIGIRYETQYPINRLTYDYLIPEIKLLIEVNGDFWHANPKIYKASDILPFPKNQVVAETLWKKDKKKSKIALKNGFKLLTLWEMDINKMSDIELELHIVEQINKLLW